MENKIKYNKIITPMRRANIWLTEAPEREKQRAEIIEAINQDMNFQVERATKYQKKNGKYHPPTDIQKY